MDADVLIVGAGAAGLMAARELSRAGKKILILEARDRIGGRIYPLSEAEFGYPAQGGAEFVHGDAPITNNLGKDIGLTFTHGVEWWDVRDTEEPVLISHASHLDKVTPNDHLIIEKLKELTDDIPVTDFLEKYFPGGEHRELRYITQERIKGYDAADPKRASAFALREEMTDKSAWRQHNIKEGYGKLLDYFASECHKYGVAIELGKKVETVDWGGKNIQIICEDAKVYRGAQLLLTVPVSVIPEINFMPALPKKKEAAKHIGYGPVVKTLIRFKSKWWRGVREQKFEKMFFMFSKEKIPTWWTQYPEPHTTLTGWAAGPQAAALESKSGEEIFEIALRSLSNIFKIHIDELHAQVVIYKVNNWIKDPFAKGGYSYSTPESEASIEELLTSVENKIYFAGEAINLGGMVATVEAALQSGKDAAVKVLSS